MNVDPTAFLSQACATPRSLLPALSTEPFVFRQTVDDFFVDEQPIYLPSGEGEHVYLHVQKRGLSTVSAGQRLVRALKADRRDLGFAGRKDALGTSTQWLSIRSPKALDEVREKAEALEGIRVLSIARHRNKLRLGHLSANRFKVRIIPDPALKSRADQLASSGMPNYFGHQRFGRGIEDALRFLEKNKRARTRLEKFWVSQVQSVVFNVWLSQRLEENVFTRVLEGDLLQKHDSGGVFECDDVAVDSARCLRGELSATGQLPGKKVRCESRDALTFLSRSLESLGVLLDEISHHPAFDMGVRRVNRVFPAEIELDEAEPDFVQFSLPKGCYATIFLAELLGRPVVDEPR